MNGYFISLGLGLIVGVLYSLVQVRSPAPPLIALLGLLGILTGEQIIPVVKKLWQGAPVRLEGRADGPQQFGVGPPNPDAGTPSTTVAVPRPADHVAARRGE